MKESSKRYIDIRRKHERTLRKRIKATAASPVSARSSQTGVREPSTMAHH
jgi:hypothetical protein